MARNNQRSSKNNNPEGRNQYNSGWMGPARDRPVATAAAAAAAVGAGVFLWSRRNQISEQISNLSEQFSDWTSSQQYGGTDSGDFEFADAGSSGMASGSTGSSPSTGRGGGKKNKGANQASGSDVTPGSTGSTGGSGGSSF